MQAGDEFEPGERRPVRPRGLHIEAGAFDMGVDTPVPCLLSGGLRRVLPEGEAGLVGALGLDTAEAAQRLAHEDGVGEEHHGEEADDADRSTVRPVSGRPAGA